MFKIFEIGDSSATRKFGGAGLGLALSRRLAEQMGAELRAQSTVGRGSRFTLTIALQHAPGDADDEDNCASVCTLEPLASMKVLVADDHPSNRRLVEVILSAAGFQVTSVENGFLALEAFRTQRFDLIMMDVQMPVMDGLTAIRNMRAYERTEGRHRSRICVLSANALPEHASASIAAGADRHIAKPVKPDELLQAAFEAEPPQSLAQFD
jgi:CheY-like chemotaxis protein